MSQALYDDIAEWYDDYLRENTLYQDVVLPTLLKLVGDVQGQNVCDPGCGQGWLTRELARKGAVMTGIDLSEQLTNLHYSFYALLSRDILYGLTLKGRNLS